MARPGRRTVLIDSNIVFRYLGRDADVLQVLEQVGIENLRVSVVSVAECVATANKRQRAMTDLFFQQLGYVQLDERTSKRFVELVHAHAPRSKWIPDALIAATALEHGWELFTLNRKDFDFVEGLKLYTPK